MFDSFYKMRDLYRTMGPLRFAIFAGGLLGVVLGMALLHGWLARHIGWPEAFGFRCHGRGCWIDDLYYSPQLLKAGNGYALALFALIWSIPGIAGVWAATILIARRWKKHSDRIRPMDDDR